MVFITLESVLRSIENSLYSQAIKNYLYIHTENKDLKNYLEISKSSANGTPIGVSERLAKMIKQCNTVGITYLLLSLQLGMTRFDKKKKKENRDIYIRLIKEFGKIPESCRKKVGNALKINKAYDYSGDLKAFRTWSKKHLEHASDDTFKTLTNAISLATKASSEESVAFYQSFEKALKQSDPFRMLASLNNAITSIRKTNLNRATEISRELSYYAGIYGEVHHVILIAMGTLLKVAKQKRDYALFFEIASIIDHYYENLVKPVPPLKRMYKPLIRIARNSALVRKKTTLKRDEVSNTKTLREFLKEKIGRTNKFIQKHGLSHTTVYRVLNGESPVVLIKTLKQLIKALEIELSFDNPKEINYVLKVMKIEEQFENHVEKLLLLPDEALTELLIRGIFMTLSDTTLDYRKLFSLLKDRERLLTYLKKDYPRMLFINRCFHIDYDFYKGRQMLFNQLIEQFDVSSRREMITLYTSLKTNKEIALLSRYFREYSRVSAVNPDSNAEVVLEKRVEDPEYEKIISFCERMKIKELPGYLCTWFFEEEERALLLQCFD